MKQILLTTWIIGVGIAVGIGLISLYGIGHPTEVLGQALRIITAPQGGTGISTSSPADVGKCIVVLDDSPFTYKLDSCGGLGSDPTVIQIDGATQSVDSPTLNFTGNSFTVVENPDDTFTLLVATTTLGLLTTNVGEGTNLYYTDARARAAITESVLGLEFNSGVLGTTTGYFVPTTTRAGTWDEAYSWGNHALSGYLLADGTRSLTANWFPGSYSIYGLNSLTLTGTSTLGFASSTALTVSGNSWLNLASTTAITVSGQTWLANASTTAVSGTNARFTNGYFTNSSLGYASSTSLTVSEKSFLNTFTATAGTTTSASSTNFFATNATITTLSSTNGTITYASSTSQTVGRSYVTGTSTLASTSMTVGTSTTFAITTAFNFLGTVITNIATWFSTTLNTVSSFVAAASSTWDFGGATSLELPNAASPTTDAAGEIALNTTLNSLSVATSTTAVEVPLYPPVRFSFASSTWTGTTTKVAYVTEPNFNELITTGICFADGTGSIVVGNGTASSSATALAAGTTTVTVNKRFNKNGTRVIFALGSPTTLTTVQCSFTRVFQR